MFHKFQITRSLFLDTNKHANARTNNEKQVPNPTAQHTNAVCKTQKLMQFSLHSIITLICKAWLTIDTPPILFCSENKLVMMMIAFLGLFIYFPFCPFNMGVRVYLAQRLLHTVRSLRTDSLVIPMDYVETQSKKIRIMVGERTGIGKGHRKTSY